MVDDSTLTRAARDLVCAQNFGGTLLRLVIVGGSYSYYYSPDGEGNSSRNWSRTKLDSDDEEVKSLEGQREGRGGKPLF